MHGGWSFCYSKSKLEVHAELRMHSSVCIQLKAASGQVVVRGARGLMAELNRDMEIDDF